MGGEKELQDIDGALVKLLNADRVTTDSKLLSRKEREGRSAGSARLERGQIQLEYESKTVGKQNHDASYRERDPHDDNR